MHNHEKFGVFVLVLSLVFGCSGSGRHGGHEAPDDAGAAPREPDAGDGGLPPIDSSGFPEPPAGSGAMVEVMVGAAGGDVELGDVSLTIPADAVPDGTMIRMTELEGRVDAVLGYAATPMYRLEPAGLTFSEPVTIRFPKPEGPDHLYVLWSELGDEDRFEPLSAEIIDGQVYVRSSHFSQWAGFWDDLFGAPYDWSGYCGDGQVNQIRRYDPDLQHYRWWVEDCDDGSRNSTQCAYGATSCDVCKPWLCEPGAGFTARCGDSRLQAYSKHGSWWFELGHRLPNGSWGDIPPPRSIGTPQSYEDDSYIYEVCDVGPNPQPIPAECPYGRRTFADCTFCGADCFSVVHRIPRWCGDNVVNGPEVCDDGNEVTEECAYGDQRCRRCKGDCSGFVATRFCGNAIKDDPSEQCDVGFLNFTTDCEYGEASCTVCNLDCQEVAGRTNQCGDGWHYTPEACDDGNTESEGCAYGDMNCTACNADCMSLATKTWCGDGTVNGPEDCDDGNHVVEVCPYGQASCDACSPTCTDVPGTVTGYCGDGTKNGPEGCDDGNTVVESCPYGEWSCSVCGSDCQMGPGIVVGYCGDGATNGPEQCDDGNDSSNDACEYGTTCQVCGTACSLRAGDRTFCGDGIINGSEQCDGSNLSGRTCASLDFLGGALRCADDCTQDASECNASMPGLSANAGYTCMVRGDGTLACWGSNQARTAEPPPGTFTSVVAGNQHACALRVDGTAVCWGSNPLVASTVPSDTFTALAAGSGNITCGLRMDGTVKCWDATGTQSTTAPSDGYFTKIAVGGVANICGLVSTGAQSCWTWGASTFGPPAGGPFMDVSLQGSVSARLSLDGVLTGNWVTANALTFTSVAVSGNQTCGITDASDVVCFEYSGGAPKTYPGPFVRVAPGGDYVCAVRADTSVVCFDAVFGESGNGGTLLAGDEFTRIATCGNGSGGTRCGIRNDGSLRCWGGESFGQPLQPPPTGPFIDVSLACDAGTEYACAVRSDQTVTCWGGNASTPGAPPAGTFTRVITSTSDAYGLRTDQTIACWGANCMHPLYAAPSGQFIDIAGGDYLRCAIRAADGTLTCWSTSISGVPSDGGYVEVAAGTDHGCARKADGSVTCFGNNYLGKAASPPGTFKRIAVSRDLSYGLRSDDTLAIWGNGNTTWQTPVQPGTFIDIAPAVDHVCGVRPSGALSCWGAGYANLP